MNAHEFLKEIALMVKEIGGDGNVIGSHNLPSQISFMVTNPEDDADYELESINPDILPGCGCWDGIIINLKRTENGNIVAKSEENNAKKSEGENNTPND
jgi:hypothetical protein